MATIHNLAYDTLFVTAICDFIVPVERTVNASGYLKIYKDQQFRWLIKTTTEGSTCSTCGAGDSIPTYVVDARVPCTEKAWNGQGVTIGADKLVETTEMLLPPQGDYSVADELSLQLINWQDPNDPQRSQLHNPQPYNQLLSRKDR